MRRTACRCRELQERHPVDSRSSSRRFRVPRSRRESMAFSSRFTRRRSAPSPTVLTRCDWTCSVHYGRSCNGFTRSQWPRSGEPMDARPILVTLAHVFHKHGLEVIMIGNAAAALQGAPVTTMDVDFLFRKTATNLRKLKQIAHSLGGMLLRPYYPVSDLYRLTRDDDSLQVDFMASIHGVR